MCLRTPPPNKEKERRQSLCYPCKEEYVFGTFFGGDLEQIVVMRNDRQGAGFVTHKHFAGPTGRSRFGGLEAP